MGMGLEWFECVMRWEVLWGWREEGEGEEREMSIEGCICLKGVWNSVALDGKVR